MGTVHESITDDLRKFIEAQHIFFVASAPSEGGHVNVSPKGLDSLRVLGPHTVAYADLTGSGIETIAHIRDNGRLTLMFCAFTGGPNIVRLQGTGRVVVPGDQEFEALAAHFPEYTGLRSFIHLTVERVSDSCGYGVPLMEYKGERRALQAWADRRSSEELADYRSERNAQSIDGLPGWSGTSAPDDGS